MNRKEILDFINRTGYCFLSTVDGDKPCVRGMAIIEACDNGIIINTGRMKDLYRQLCVNPNTELCFFNQAENTQVRISGVLELTEDRAVQDKVLERLPFLKPFVEQNGYGMLATYIMKKGVATVWTMETNFAPKTYIEI